MAGTMSGKTISFKMKLPSFRVKLVPPPPMNVNVNPLLLVILAVVILYAAFENTRIETARLKGDIDKSTWFTEEISANLTELAKRQAPSTIPAPMTTTTTTTTATIVQTPPPSKGDSELVKSLSMSVEKLNSRISEENSLDRYYSSKIQTTNAMRVAAATAAQNSYSDNADQCLKLSDSTDGSEKNMTNCRNARSIYYWVKDNVKFEPAYEIGYLKGDVQLPSETLSNMLGGSADHALLLVSLLRSRGMEAYLVAIPSVDYLIAAVRVKGLSDSYPDSISWKTATSTGIKPAPYEYFGSQKDLVLLDARCKSCNFGMLGEDHKKLGMKMLTYYNATLNN